ncbi:transposase [Klebsiella pneumoniae]|nr:transposase [Klebsiella pneumoniae]
MQHRIILPGATTLTRLISEVREKATLRLWNKLALIPSAEQRSQLEMLLGPTDCSRLSSGITEKRPCDHQWSGV